VQNMVMVAECARKEVVVHVSSHLRRRGIVEAESDSTSYTDASRRCLSAALVKRHHARDRDADNILEMTTALYRRVSSASRRPCRGAAAVDGRPATVHSCR